jgi:uncharacterized protein
MAVKISKHAARRFVLGKQGLWPGRRWEGEAGTRDAITACENLQLDPLVIVARSHDLMLHSRVAGYETTFFETLTYEQRLFFDWGGWLAVRPMDELPYWRALMHRHRDTPKTAKLVAAHRATFDEIRDLLRERGTLSGRDFKAEERRKVVSYRGTKDSTLVLYYLWLVGEAMTHHREGFERVYALTETVAPPNLITARGDPETDRFIARKAVAFAGIGRIGPLSRSLVRKVAKAEELAIEQSLFEAGEIMPVEVDGWPGRHFVLGADADLVDDVASGRVPRAWSPIDATTDNEVVLLSPLDPVMERKRANALFGFDYVWEIYKKPELVTFGRYAMPILWGDQLAGRMDLRTDRKSSALVINGIWLEHGALARSPQFLDALQRGVGRALSFLKVDRVDATAVVNPRVRRAITKAIAGR